MPVSGTRFAPDSAVRTRSTRPSGRARFFAWISSTPRCQVLRTKKIAAPSTSGNQPPSLILVALAPKNSASTRKNTASIASIGKRVFLPILKTTTPRIIVPMIMSPFTAMP